MTRHLPNRIEIEFCNPVQKLNRHTTDFLYSKVKYKINLPSKMKMNGCSTWLSLSSLSGGMSCRECGRQTESEREQTGASGGVRINESHHHISWFVCHNFNSNRCCFWWLLHIHNTDEEFELEKSDVCFIEALVSLTVGVKPQIEIYSLNFSNFCCCCR